MSGAGRRSPAAARSGAGLWPALAFFLLAPFAATAIELSFPLDCTLGRDCFYIQGVDRDPGPGAQDFRCGPLAYDGHKGVDFALPSLRHIGMGTAVLAAAPGRVRAVRDGMPDIPQGRAEAPPLGGRDCGNGLVVEHEDGWTTQYCHLRQGSLAVAEGERVARGQMLGMVGVSGLSEFAHLHMTTRRVGAVIDPFDGQPMAEACRTDTPPVPLWDRPIDAPVGGFLAAGFTQSVLTQDDAMADAPHAPSLARDAGAIVFWITAFRPQTGDEIRLLVTDPEGETLVEHISQLDRARAVAFRYAGKRGRGRIWQPGLYTGTAHLLRNGREIASIEVETRVSP